MKMFGKYLKHRRNIIVVVAVLFVTFTAISILYDQKLDAVIYSFELNLTFLLIAGIVDYVNFSRKHRAIVSHIEQDEVFRFDDDEAGVAVDLIEEDYRNLVNKILEDKRKSESVNMKNMAELKDYYAMWAHQIKTPISAVDLMTQESDGGLVNSGELKDQLFKIDFYVDAVMNYLRLEDMSSDYEFTVCNVDAIVKKAVKKFASQFIRKHISVKISNTDRVVCTDEKWLGFILEQLLSNSIKYTMANGKVYICIKEDLDEADKLWLVIRDTGIGIREEDIPRIMERGYTGFNGRMDKNSTGIGLYLCKKAADKLRSEIVVESEIDVGTSVSISLSRDKIVRD